MLDPSEIYEVDPEVADRLAELSTHLHDGGPVLVHAVRGFVDAGNAGQLAADHLRRRARRPSASRRSTSTSCSTTGPVVP